MATVQGRDILIFFFKTDDLADFLQVLFLFVQTEIKGRKMANCPLKIKSSGES